MNKVFEYIVRDYEGSTDALQIVLKRKLPKWLLVVYYAIMLPIGMALLPLVYIYTKIRVYWMFRKIRKEYGR